MKYLQLGHFNIIFDSHKVTRSSRQVTKKENEATYLVVYYNIFIDMHHHCLGGDLMHRYIGRQMGGYVSMYK